MEAILYAEVYLVCIIVVGLLYRWISRKEELASAELWISRVYMCFLANFFSNLLFTVFNRIWVIDAVVTPLSYAFKSLYMLTLCCGVVCWCCYAEIVIYRNAKDLKRFQAAMAAVLGVCAVIVVLNLFIPIIFTIDADHVYRRHFMFHGLLLILLAVSLVSTWRLMKCLKKEADPVIRNQYGLMASFPVCLVVALVFSPVGEKIPVICVCVMVELLCIFVGNSNSQISIDQLTRVNNRQNLDRFMNYKLIDHSDQIWFLMMDVDEFKHINDTYGHLEGDKALKEVSGALKAACHESPSRPFIARYGGDEFVIVAEGTEQSCQSIRDNIGTMLAKLNTPARPYRLELSVGCAKYTSGMTYMQLVAEADEDMYKNKVAKKARKAQGFAEEAY